MLLCNSNLYFNLCLFYLSLLKKHLDIQSQEQAMSECWQRFKAGDEQAFAKIYECYVGTLYNYGYHFVTDTDLVQDAIQDLFVDIWRMRQNLADTTSVKYYLFRSLRRKLRLLVEPKSLFVELSETDESYTDSPSYESQLIENETNNEQIRNLQKVLTELPPRQIEAIRLRFFDNFSLEEVASIMQMNEQSVRNLIQRSLKNIRHLLGPTIALLMALSDFF